MTTLPPELRAAADQCRRRYPLLLPYRVALEVCGHFGVTETAFRTWKRRGEIEMISVAGSSTRYRREKVLHLCGAAPDPDTQLPS